MAKDKSKKADKAEKTVATSSEFARPSEAPAAGEGWNLTEEAEGRLILFTPLREEEVDTTDYGPKKVVVADVVVIDEKKPEQSEPHDDVYVWGGYLKGALRGFINDRRVLGRLVRGTKKERGNFPWLLEDATDADIALAQAYLTSVAAAVAAELGGEAKKKAKK